LVSLDRCRASILTRWRLMSDYIQKQMEHGAGSWRTYNTTINNSQFIVHAMRNLKKTHPNKRIRAVDKDGRLVDMM